MTDGNPEAARLIALYRERRAEHPATGSPAMTALMRIGATAAWLPGRVATTCSISQVDAWSRCRKRPPRRARSTGARFRG